MNTFCLRNNLFLFLLTSLVITAACAKSNLSVALVKSDKDKKSVVNAIVSKYKNDELLTSQLISVKGNDLDFLAIPALSSDKPAPGCYIQTLNSKRELIGRYLIEKNEDAQSCEAVLAIFPCRLQKMRGLGVIYGMRLGSNNYYTESSYFEIVANGILKYDDSGTKLISGVDSATLAKKKLECIK